MEVPVYKDRDILKTEQILRTINKYDMSDLPDDARVLLYEFHNSITLGLCPHFVNTYDEKATEKDLPLMNLK